MIGIGCVNQIVLFTGLFVDAFVGRVLLRELFRDSSNPKWGLIWTLYGISIVDFILRVVFFLPILCAPRVKSDGGSIPSGKLVSVIFPAYNEADGIAEICLTALRSTDSPNVEFIVVDDRSSDLTWEVLKKVASDTQDKRLKLVAGRERGKVFWRGKNWAVWQGYEASKGDYLLFCDADLWLMPGAIEAFLSSMQCAGVGWISFLPKTRFSCFAEYMFSWPGTVIAQALLPNRINQGGKVYAFGQCNLFTRETYEALGGHREVGHLVAESHSLAQLAKQRRMRIRCELAFRQAELEWYHDFWECWKGQLKSIQARLTKKLPIIGRPLPQCVMIALANLGMLWVVIPWFLLPIQAAKLITTCIYSDSMSKLSKTDMHVGIALVTSILTHFLKRVLGRCAFGYDMKYWWLILTSSVLRAALAVCACQPGGGTGRWAVSSKPQDFALPKEVPLMTSCGQTSSELVMVTDMEAPVKEHREQDKSVIPMPGMVA